MADNMAGMGQHDQTGGQGEIQPATPQEVEEFLMNNPVNPEGRDMFMSMDPMMQRMVLNRGSLQGARDATGAFIGRMKSIMRTAKAMPAMSASPQDVQSMRAGTLASFDESKGFGFITPADLSQDVFFHMQAVTNGGNEDMIAGATLRFEVGVNERNGKTHAVRVVLDVGGFQSNQFGGKGYGKGKGKGKGGKGNKGDGMAEMMESMGNMMAEMMQWMKGGGKGGW